MKKYKHTNWLILTILLLGIACKQEDNVKSNCKEQIEIDENAFVNAPNDDLDIIAVDVFGDCLKIRFASGGCDGSTWEYKLVGSEANAKSLPPQKNIRLSLKDDEECEAYITKEIEYDLTNAQVNGGEIILLLEGWREDISYTY